MAVSATLVLRFADVGTATYGSLRVVGEPARTVTWVVEEPLLLAALADVDDALPEPVAEETVADALRRAFAEGLLARPDAELGLAYRLGVLLLSQAAWDLVEACAGEPRAALFVAPSARLARVPWILLAVPRRRPDADALAAACTAAVTFAGTVPARIAWDDPGTATDGTRLVELVDVLMAPPANIVNASRPHRSWASRAGAPRLLVLDPRVPHQRADSALGSVLGRPDPGTALARHVAEDVGRGAVLPEVRSAVELFRRVDADRHWLAAMLERGPARLLYVGHATAAEAGSADRAALYLAEERPLTAADLLALDLPIPPRVALLACASGGDYRFDEATGLVAAAVLGGAQLVTATLWSLPTTAGYRRFAAGAADPAADPMGELIVAVDVAHDDDHAGRAVNRWQREALRRWRSGDDTASPLYWAALATFAVDGAR